MRLGQPQCCHLCASEGGCATSASCALLHCVCASCCRKAFAPSLICEGHSPLPALHMPLPSPPPPHTHSCILECRAGPVCAWPCRSGLGGGAAAGRGVCAHAAAAHAQFPTGEACVLRGWWGAHSSLICMHAGPAAQGAAPPSILRLPLGPPAHAAPSTEPPRPLIAHPPDASSPWVPALSQGCLTHAAFPTTLPSPAGRLKQPLPEHHHRHDCV